MFLMSEKAGALLVEIQAVPRDFPLLYYPFLIYILYLKILILLTASTRSFTKLVYIMANDEQRKTGRPK